VLRKLLLIGLIPLLVACGSPQNYYGESESKVFSFTVSNKGDRGVLAYLDKKSFQRYFRDTDFSNHAALEHLLGGSGEVFITLTAEQEEALASALFELEGLEYQEILPTVEVMVSLAIKHAPDLLKRGGIAKLDRLEVPGGKALLQRLVSSQKNLRIYNLDVFLPATRDLEFVTKWVNSWRENALREVGIE